MERDSKYTHIAITQATKGRLEALKGEKTWDDFLISLLEQSGLEMDKVILIPQNTQMEEDIIQAIEEARPPPEWRLLLTYFIIGFLGGAVGLYLAIRP